MTNTPQRPFLKWAGAKTKVVNRIKARLPQGNCLLEPFVGSGALFLNTEYEYYRLNDINQDLINLYKIIQQQGQAFIDHAAQYFHPQYNQSQAYYDLRERFNHSSDLIERAALFIYFNRHGYNGLCRFSQSGKFNVPFGRYQAPGFPRKYLLRFLAKSKYAEFYCEDFEIFMQRAKPREIIYCDPPYVPLSKTAFFKQYSTLGFTEDDQRRLAQLAQNLRKKNITVLISNHDTPFTREIYANARIESFNVQRLISCKGEKRLPVTELLAEF
ncbi:MAG: Dam family site-specific DNA-(adenine-N6)-methyltransferase [Legionellales bacterium]|nr:Dam family site-specific DNA-(adenine-N6)-methyltransferase [Legionellales bacterium]